MVVLSGNSPHLGSKSRFGEEEVLMGWHLFVWRSGYVRLPLLIHLLPSYKHIINRFLYLLVGILDVLLAIGFSGSHRQLVLNRVTRFSVLILVPFAGICLIILTYEGHLVHVLSIFHLLLGTPYRLRHLSLHLIRILRPGQIIVIALMV